jgi:GT2 family glycosyltransferase
MSSDQALVSIIIPVFNGAKYLREAIDSALSQTHRPLEVLVVNDGSTDGGATSGIARSYGDRIRLIEKENGGVASALNAGIARMRGDYFSWLSHDDVYYPDKIARQLAYLSASGQEREIAYCNWHVIDSESRILETIIVDPAVREEPVLLVLGVHIGGCSLLIPKRAFDEAGLFNEALLNSQDNELWMRMVVKGFRLRYVPDVLLQSRAHAEQGSRVTSQRHGQERDRFYHWALEFMGPGNRRANAAGIVRILLQRRRMGDLRRYLGILSREAGASVAGIAAARGTGRAAASFVGQRLTSLPVLRRLSDAFSRRRFRSSSGYWEARYQRGETSGIGSAGRFADFKAAVLNDFVAKRGITTVAEFGCGDGQQLGRFTFPRYLGLDVSPAAVDLCRRLYRDDVTKEFLVYAGQPTLEAIRRFGPELTLSLDVIYHLVEDAVFEEYIANLFGSASRYVIVYSTDFDRRYTSRHQVDRKFTEYVERVITDWRLVETVPNPHKGPETQSDFYIYEKVAGRAAAS